MKAMRRTFEAAKHPTGSAERARLNLDAMTSEYMPSYRYIICNDDGSRVDNNTRTFRTKREAEAELGIKAA